MRFNPDRAYDEIVYDLDEILARQLPEFLFRQFIIKMAKKTNNINIMYTLADLVGHVFPKDFPPNRVTAFKRLALKVYTIYDARPPKRTLCQLLYESKTPTRQIAKLLGIAQPTVYHHLKQAVEHPSQCMLTYGEYDVMQDFMDCWRELHPDEILKEVE